MVNLSILITDAIVTKLNVHINVCVVAINYCFKFHLIPLNGCLVMTQFVDFRVIQGQ